MTRRFGFWVGAAAAAVVIGLYANHVARDQQLFPAPPAASPGTTLPAGRNRVANGDFDRWLTGMGPRGVTVAPGTVRNTADGWVAYADGVGGAGQAEFSRPVLTRLGRPPLSLLRWREVRGATAGTPSLSQTIPGAGTLAGDFVLSFYARADAPLQMDAVVVRSFGTSAHSNVTPGRTVAVRFTAGPQWRRFIFPVSLVPVGDVELGDPGTDSLVLSFVPAPPSLTRFSTAFTLEITQVQLESGRIPTPFEATAWEALSRGTAASPADAGPAAGTTLPTGRNRVANGDFARWPAAQEMGVITVTVVDGTARNTARGWVGVADGVGGTGQAEFSRRTLDRRGQPPLSLLQWRQLQRATAGTPSLTQAIPGVSTLAGGDAVLSFYARADTPVDMVAMLIRNFGTGAHVRVTPARAVAVVRFTPDAQWRKFAFPLSLPPVGNAEMGDRDTDVLQLSFIPDQAGATFTVDVTDVQLESGRSPTLFEAVPVEAQVGNAPGRLDIPATLAMGKYPGNPILTPACTGWPSCDPRREAEWDSFDVASPSVARKDNLYHMFYEGDRREASAGKAEVIRNARIGHATSADGIRWTKDPQNPVFTGIEGSDEESVLSPMVLNINGAFWMYYTSGTFKFVYLALSSDGVHWERAGPVLAPTPGGWDQYGIGEVAVLRSRGEFLMWYTGDLKPLDLDPRRAIGFATSADGIHWTKETAGPVLAPEPGRFDDLAVSHPSVLLDQGVYRMWYTCINRTVFDQPAHPLGAHICYAWSKDGRHWTKSKGNPVVRPQNLPFERDAVGSPYVVRERDIYRMWYEGSVFWDLHTDPPTVQAAGIGHITFTPK